METKYKIKVISGSVRDGRFSDEAAEWIAKEIGEREGVEVEVLYLTEYDMPFFDQAMTPSMKSSPYPYEVVEKFTAKIAEADAFIMVAPEYNHGPTAVLKNAIDWVSKEWNKKPVAFFSYGSMGGVRAVEQLRQIVIELQMAPIRNAVHISGNKYIPVLLGQTPGAEVLAEMKDSAAAMIDQLLWWTEALAIARNK